LSDVKNENGNSKPEHHCCERGNEDYSEVIMGIQVTSSPYHVDDVEGNDGKDENEADSSERLDQAVGSV